jgi:hypothetical protein
MCVCAMHELESSCKLLVYLLYLQPVVRAILASLLL